jgi:hypothetical protein
MIFVNGLDGFVLGGLLTPVTEKLNAWLAANGAVENYSATLIPVVPIFEHVTEVI